MTEVRSSSHALTARFDAALQFASDSHRQQVRKSTKIPYMTHLMAVSALVGEYGGDEDLMIAALLHDSMEDQGVTRQEIEKLFGSRVANIVDGCTDTTEQPKPAWRVRKERYVAHLGGADHDTKLVSAADKLHNARSILMDLRTVGADTWLRFNASADEILWYYRSNGAFQKGWNHPVVEELERTISQIEQIS